jgi:four helix bundle protein
LEFKRFFTISLRSAYEVICVLEIVERLKYLNEQDFNKPVNQCDELSAMLFGLMKKLKADR